MIHIIKQLGFYFATFYLFSITISNFSLFLLVKIINIFSSNKFFKSRLTFVIISNFSFIHYFFLETRLIKCNANFCFADCIFSSTVFMFLAILSSNFFWQTFYVSTLFFSLSLTFFAIAFAIAFTFFAMAFAFFFSIFCLNSFSFYKFCFLVFFLA